MTVYQDCISAFQAKEIGRKICEWFGAVHDNSSMLHIFSKHFPLLDWKNPLSTACTFRLSHPHYTATFTVLVIDRFIHGVSVGNRWLHRAWNLAPRTINKLVKMNRQKKQGKLLLNMICTQIHNSSDVDNQVQNMKKIICSIVQAHFSWSWTHHEQAGTYKRYHSPNYENPFIIYST